MTPREYQTIGSYLDILFLVGAGVFAYIAPKKLVAAGSTAEEREKKTKMLKICGVCMVACGLLQLAFELR
jgi:hypothetical protein